MTGAGYFRAMDTESLEEIYEELDRLEPMEFEEEEYVPTKSLYHYPLGGAVLITLLFSLVLSIVSALKRMNYSGNPDVG